MANRVIKLPRDNINELTHHGVKGMKWGIRRYQNKDGTRTPEGKRRERADTTSSSSESPGKKPKSIKSMSNEDLRKVNERLRLESEYRKLTSSKTKKGESWVRKSLQDASSQALTEFSKNAMIGTAKLLVKNLSPEFAESAFNIKDKKKG